MNQCIFCQIARKKSPAKIIYEDRKFLAFYDINPKASLHILIITKRHISSLAKTRRKDLPLLGRMIWRARLLAQKHKVAKGGYKLILNCGPGAGQLIGHLHLHLLAGKSLTRPLKV